MIYNILSKAVWGCVPNNVTVEIALFLKIIKKIKIPI